MISRADLLASFPKWRSQPLDLENLREIAPGLFLGGAFAPRAHVPWNTIIDFYGSSSVGSSHRQTANVDAGYRRARCVKTLPFNDGLDFPKGALDSMWHAIRASHGPVLLHYQAGLSRSASAGYAVLRRGWGLSHDEARFVVRVKSGFPLEGTLRSARVWVNEKKGRGWD